MAKKDSNYMFPISPKEGAWEQELGMTKREYFAAKAMQGLLSGGFNMYEDVAGTAVDFADQLINALNNSEKNEKEN